MWQKARLVVVSPRYYTTQRNTVLVTDSDVKNKKQKAHTKWYLYHVRVASSKYSYKLALA
jgi:hypothetical protein